MKASLTALYALDLAYCYKGCGLDVIGYGRVFAALKLGIYGVYLTETSHMEFVYTAELKNLAEGDYAGYGDDIAVIVCYGK